MNILRCPLRMRWHATVGETPAPEMGERARRGCLGMVGGNEAIWCVFEWGREVGFVRAEVGVDGIGRYCEPRVRCFERKVLMIGRPADYADAAPPETTSTALCRRGGETG